MSNDHGAIMDLAGRALREEPTEVSQEAIVAMVQRGLDRGEDFLRAVADHGSPLYVFERDVHRDAANRFLEAVEQAIEATTRVYYAVKSNSHPVVAETFLECGLGLDVSSGAELALFQHVCLADATGDQKDALSLLDPVVDQPTDMLSLPVEQEVVRVVAENRH